MDNPISEHIVDGIKVRVFDLPDGAYCALIVSTDVVFQAIFSAELKTLGNVSDHVNQSVRYPLPAVPPTSEMLPLMKSAALEHMHSLKALDQRDF